MVKHWAGAIGAALAVLGFFWSFGELDEWGLRLAIFGLIVVVFSLQASKVERDD